jgi:hypothetical protein
VRTAKEDLEELSKVGPSLGYSSGDYHLESKGGYQTENQQSGLSIIRKKWDYLLE